MTNIPVNMMQEALESDIRSKSWLLDRLKSLTPEGLNKLGWTEQARQLKITETEGELEQRQRALKKITAAWNAFIDKAAANENVGDVSDAYSAFRSLSNDLDVKVSLEHVAQQWRLEKMGRKLDAMIAELETP